jgi:uncharacterized coiled-coil DUF342 family protein
MHTEYNVLTDITKILEKLNKQDELLLKTIESLNKELKEANKKINRLAKCIKDCDDELAKTVGGTDEGD